MEKNDSILPGIFFILLEILQTDHFYYCNSDMRQSRLIDGVISSIVKYFLYIIDPVTQICWIYFQFFILEGWAFVSEFRSLYQYVNAKWLEHPSCPHPKINVCLWHLCFYKRSICGMPFGLKKYWLQLSFKDIYEQMWMLWGQTQSVPVVFAVLQKRMSVSTWSVCAHVCIPACHGTSRDVIL